MEEDFCTHENPCGVEQGDCDSNDMCMAGLICGLNNCHISLACLTMRLSYEKLGILLSYLLPASADWSRGAVTATTLSMTPGIWGIQKSILFSRKVF